MHAPLLLSSQLQCILSHCNLCWHYVSHNHHHGQVINNEAQKPFKFLQGVVWHIKLTRKWYTPPLSSTATTSGARGETSSQVVVSSVFVIDESSKFWILTPSGFSLDGCCRHHLLVHQYLSIAEFSLLNSGCTSNSLGRHFSCRTTPLPSWLQPVALHRLSPSPLPCAQLSTLQLAVGLLTPTLLDSHLAPTCSFVGNNSSLCVRCPHKQQTSITWPNSIFFVQSLTELQSHGSTRFFLCRFLPWLWYHVKFPWT